MDLFRPQILSLYFVKRFQNGRYLRPWWCMLYVLGRQWISVGICCHLSTPQCQWYVTTSNKPNESILSFLPLTSVPVYDALQLLTSLWWSNFLFKLRKSSEFFLHTHLCFVTSLSQCLICRLVYILLDCLHTIHCKCPTPIMALIPCKSAYNCVQQSSWRLSFFLLCNEPVWLAHDYRGTKKILKLRIFHQIEVCTPKIKFLLWTEIW